MSRLQWLSLPLIGVALRCDLERLGVVKLVTEVGATERCYPREWGDYFTRAAMPPVRVSDFNMSSVSAAQ